MARRRIGRKKTVRRRPVRRARTSGRRMAIPRGLSMGTRYKELFLENNLRHLRAVDNQFFIPLYNLFDIAQGQLFNQRSGTNVFFHKIQFQVSVFPNSNNTAIFENPEDLGGNDNNQLEDPRVRVFMVNQKRMASNMPIDATPGGPVFPYYSTTSTTNYQQALNLPLPTTNDSGMIGKVDDRNYMVRQDNMYNLLQNTSYPILNLDQTVNLREQYSYPFDNSGFPLNDTTLWYKVPQCWIYLPKQQNITYGESTWKIKIYMKVIYDSI